MSALPRPDFLSNGPRPSSVGWALAATGLAAWLLAVAQAWSAATDAGALRGRVAVAQARADAQHRRAPATSPADSAAQQAAAQVAARLDYPWPQVFASLEAATPVGVQWLAFEHENERKSLRLEGLAGDADAALRIVDALGREPGWSAVVLTQLTRPEGEPVPRGDGGGSADKPSLRFDMTARIEPVAVAPARAPRG